MSETYKSNNNANFIWNIADHLRGSYKATDYAKVVLPFTILRRMDCILEATKDAVVEANAKYADKPEAIRENLLLAATNGLKYYNTSPFTLTTLLDDPANLAENLIVYIDSFSDSVKDIFSRFRLEEQVKNLDETELLYLTVQKYATADFHTDTISNYEMGLLFEELIRKFAEDSAADNGEFFTPRDAIELLVRLLFAADVDMLRELEAPIRSVYDPTAGTGGMLSTSSEYLAKVNPNAELNLFGQELNPESYAICKSDMLAKGQDVNNIRLGNTLTKDQFPETKFDYIIANPPYGSKWETERPFVEKEHKELGFEGRFGPGLPASSDGQLLFLLHAVSKIREVKADGTGGGRAGIVLNGSSLFSGDAGSGASNIRRWLFESDYVDAIVALPTNMFYATGIATYIWLIDTNKPAERKGKVQLIDATETFHKMRKSLGGKTRTLTPEDIKGIVNSYHAFEDVRVDTVRKDPITGEERIFTASEVEEFLKQWGDFNSRGEFTGKALEGMTIEDSQAGYKEFFASYFHISKIFNTEDFGFNVVTVEQPLIGLYQWNADAKVRLQADTRFQKWAVVKQEEILTALDSSAGLAISHENRNAALSEFNSIKTTDEKTGKQKAVTKADREVIMDALLDPATRNKDGQVSYIDNDESKGFYVDKELTDTETISLSEEIDAYIEREVKPFAPNAVVDHSKTKVGYEIPFNRHFYKAEPTRELNVIQDELSSLVASIAVLLGA